jgi:hypothetical protein
MLIYAGTHGCEELKDSGKCGCLFLPHQAVVVNDVIVHCPLSTVQVFRIPGGLRVFIACSQETWCKITKKVFAINGAASDEVCQGLKDAFVHLRSRKLNCLFFGSNRD